MQITSATITPFAYAQKPCPSTSCDDTTVSSTEEKNGSSSVKSDEKTEKAHKSQSSQQLDQQEQQQVKELQARDREVRAHEAAHKATAGQLAKGGATFSYERGPDGRLYAVGGEVSIDTSPVGDDPQATLQKANQIRAAALAPAQPSSQDLAVAAEAVMMAAQARSDLATQQHEEMQQTLNRGKNTEQHDQAARKYTETAAIGAGNTESEKIDLMA